MRTSVFLRELSELDGTGAILFPLAQARAYQNFEPVLLRVHLYDIFNQNILFVFKIKNFFYQLI